MWGREGGGNEALVTRALGVGLVAQESAQSQLRQLQQQLPFRLKALPSCLTLISSTYSSTSTPERLARRPNSKGGGQGLRVKREEPGQGLWARVVGNKGNGQAWKRAIRVCR